MRPHGDFAYWSGLVPGDSSETLWMKAMGLLSYGESSQPGSGHRGDQLGLLSQKKLRPIWLTRTEVEEHEEARKRF